MPQTIDPLLEDMYVLSHPSVITVYIIACEFILTRWIPEEFIDSQLTLIEVKTWCIGQ